MKSLTFYTYLGKCIQKARYNTMTQVQLAKGICSKATISNIENTKLPSRKKIFYILIQKLGYHCTTTVDHYIIQATVKYTLEMIAYNRKEEIDASILKMKEIIDRNPNNILFLDYQILYNYLHTHYCLNEMITPNPYDLNTLPYVNEDFYILLLHTYFENLLLHRGLMSFYHIYKQLNVRTGNSLLDFFYILTLQIDDQTLEVFDIYDSYKEEFQKDKKLYQSFRYSIIISMGHIVYEPQKAIRNFNIIQSVCKESIKTSHYYYLIAFGQASICIKQRHFNKAYVYLDKSVSDYPRMLPYALPYLLFLSYRINIKVNPSYLIKNEHPLCNACINYHHYRNDKISGNKHIQYMMKQIFPFLKEFRMSDPFIILLRTEEQAQYNRRACNVTAIHFYKKLKESCKEVSLL